MEGYIVSLQNDLLRVTLVGSDIVAEKKVGTSDTQVLAEELGGLILENFGPKAQKLPLNFLIEPQDIYLNFLTVTKGNDDDDKLFEFAKSKLGAQGVAIEGLYYSYQKIAPFVYQLVGIEKEKLEKYLEISNDLGFELRSIIPWVLLIPKESTNSGRPVIFVLNTGKDKFLALSELGGIYHLGLLDNTKSSDEIDELIQKLSVYQRSSPITDIFTLNMSKLGLGDKYKITPLKIKDLHVMVTKGCSDPITLETQTNLLTLLPLPEPAKKLSPAIYAGVVAAILVVGGFFGIRVVRNNRSSAEAQLAQQNNASPLVLSETEETTESTSEEKTEVNEEVEINRAFLKIRIENGTNFGGLAGQTEDLLAPLGYEVVGIGDAQENRTTTLVRFNKDNSPVYKDLLVGDLVELYEDVQVTNDLEEGLDYDVLIIIGEENVPETQ